MTEQERSKEISQENQNGKVIINLPNLDDLYEEARDQFTGREGVTFSLSETFIGDSEFDSEVTTLTIKKVMEKGYFGGYGGGSPDKYYLDFHFQSTIEFSDQKTHDNNGYFDKNKQRQIKEVGGYGEIRKEINLGPYDKEDTIEWRINRWKVENPEPQKENLSEREYKETVEKYQRELESYVNALKHMDLNLKSINISQESKMEINSYRDYYGPCPLNQTEFINLLHIYCHFYKTALEQIYKTDAVPIPNLEINFQAPKPIEEESVPVKPETVTETKAIETEHIKKEGFGAIVGQDKAVDEAKKLVRAIQNPEVYQKRGVKLPKGILFYGPPGTGKTMLARAIAQESGARLIEVSVADIGSKWHGESEKMLQQIFDDAASNGRTILFFDEFDSFAPPRDDSYEITRKIIAIFNQNMDGIRANSNITVIAATNRPEGIDLAAKRSGRFDKIIEVPLPDEKGRIAILQKYIDKAQISATDPDSLFSTLDLNKIGQETNGLSGADLANIVNRTLEEKLEKELEGQTWTPITTDNILDMVYKIILERTEGITIDLNKKK